MYLISTHPKQRIAIGDSFQIDIQSFFMPVLHARKVLMLVGKQSFQATEQSKQLTEMLASEDSTIVHTIVCEENPSEVELTNIIKNLPEHDCILAVGGGSVIDTAKMIKHNLGNGTPLYVIYTRFGSATIVTPFFIYDNHEFKIGELDQNTIPDFVYVSLELMEVLSFRQRLIGVSDILAHATESYLSTAGDASLKNRAQTLLEQLTSDMSTWPLSKLVEADIEAGLIEQHCLVLLPHALGHYLTYTTNLPHGIASLVTLPTFVEFYINNGAMDRTLGTHVRKLAIYFATLYFSDTELVALRNKLITELDTALPLIARYMPFVFELSPVPITLEGIKKILTQNI